MGSYGKTGLGKDWLKKKKEWKVQPDKIVKDINQAVDFILSEVNT